MTPPNPYKKGNALVNNILEQMTYQALDVVTGRVHNRTIRVRNLAVDELRQGAERRRAAERIERVLSNEKGL